MPRRAKLLPTDLTLPEIRRLLAIKERTVELEERRGELQKELAQVEAEIARLASGAPARTGPKTGKAARRGTGRKAARKKAAGRKAGRKKVARRKAAATKAGRKKAPARKKVATRKRASGAGKAAARKKAPVRKKVAGGRKAVRKKAASGAAPRKTLEDVIAEVIRARGEPIPFQELLATITGQKLFASRSRNFANVLRRTLSTSKRIKRVGRGVYDVA